MKTLPFRDAEDFGRAVPAVEAHLRAGGLIAYPTETVYGFGCALLPSALAALARLKQREARKPFLLLVLEDGRETGLTWTDSARSLAQAFWPGPLTLALRAEPGAFPAAVVADGSVAIRATPHPGVRALISAIGGPLTSTSANVPGRPPATSADETRGVLELLNAETESMQLLDGGRLPPSPPSTVLNCAIEPPRLVRAGAISLERLCAVVKEIDV